MSFQVTDEVKERNRELTAECQELWDGLRFAEIKEHSLVNPVVPVIFIPVALMFFGIFIYFVCLAVITGQPDLLGIIPFLIFTLIFTAIDIFAWVYVYKSYRYGREWYLVRDGKNDFQIWCAFDGQKYTVRTIVNLTRHKVLFVSDSGECSQDGDEDSAVGVTGFRQFLAAPDKVFDARRQSAAMCRNVKLRYKNKKVKGDTTFYYFPAIDGSAFGTRYARCIAVEKGVLKYICTEEAKSYVDGKTTLSKWKKLYDKVNDDEFKIHIPNYVREYADGVGFVLPKDSANIVYDN